VEAGAAFESWGGLVDLERIMIATHLWVCRSFVFVSCRGVSLSMWSSDLEESQIKLSVGLMVLVDGFRGFRFRV
jgi:hypothetical protein